MKKAAIFLLVIFFTSTFLGCLNHKSNNYKTGNDFSFITIDGEKKHLHDYRGKVVILDLMGVSCKPCQYEMFELEKIFKNYSSEQIAIISIDVWATVNGETAQDVKYLKEAYEAYGIYLNWTFGIDDGFLWNNYVINGAVPSIYIFDQYGRVYFKHAGVTVFSEVPEWWPKNQPKPPILKPIIDDLLGEK